MQEGDEEAWFVCERTRDGLRGYGQGRKRAASHIHTIVRSPTSGGVPEGGAGVVAVDDDLLQPVRLVRLDRLQEILHPWWRVVMCVCVWKREKWE